MTELWLALALLGIIAAIASLARSVDRLRKVSQYKPAVKVQITDVAKSIVRRRLLFLIALVPASLAAIAVLTGYPFVRLTAIICLMLFELVFVVSLVWDEIEDGVMGRRETRRRSK